MIVSQNTQNALMEIIAQCFWENRKIDRMVSVLGVDLVCPNAANKIHHQIAHYFPQLSDLIGEKCLERYNISVLYGETPNGIENYNTAIELLDVLQKYVLDFQIMLMGVCKIAQENNDFHVYVDLMDLLGDYNKIVEQVILLNDKIHQYGEDRICSFDHDIDTFWILGEDD